MSGAYLAGRSRARLQTPFKGELQAYASEFLDGQTVPNAEYKHCTFVNISFKGVELTNGAFINCVFINCYFRNTQFRSSQFIGCQFISCDFHHPAVIDTAFKYSRFRGNYLPFNEMKHNFPSEPNLRRRLAHELALAAESAGASKEARRYRLEAIHARQSHLRAAWLGEGTWYQQKYQGLRRLQAAASWAGGLLNGWIWGHGERARPLIAWALVLACGIFPLSLWLAGDGLRPVVELRYIDLLIQSLAAFIPAGLAGPFEAASTTVRLLFLTESLMGLVVTGLFVSLLFRAISRR